MNRYESMFIIDPGQSEEDSAKIIEKMERVIVESGGKVEGRENMGKRKTAYKIGKNVDGFYVLVYFTASPQAIPELERNYKVTDSVIKHITVRSEGPPKGSPQQTQGIEQGA
jgi:small subunit ribosomal protein S6